MHFAGIDIGSRTIQLVVVDEKGNKVLGKEADTGADPMVRAKKMIKEAAFDRIMATGYGRNLFELAFEAPTVTEIKAHAVGARACFPQAFTVLDIGGQDSKAISLFENGRVKKFEMNDRCAAGTGKFLEIMAKALGFGLAEFGEKALFAKDGLTISSMCTVFAESEVTGLIARGQKPEEIARGLHDSVIRRAAGMISRVSSDGDIVFTGGVANNRCMTTLLAQKLGRTVRVPEFPQQAGALGAALLAKEAG